MLSTSDKIKVIKRFQREQEQAGGVHRRETVVPSEKDYKRSEGKRVDLPDDRSAGMKTAGYMKSLEEEGITADDLASKADEERYAERERGAGAYEDMQLLRGRVALMLDSVADRLESSGYVKAAFELDRISDTLDVMSGGGDIAFIPHTVLSEGLQTLPDKMIPLLKAKSGASSVEYHKDEIRGNCNCPDKAQVKQLYHVVLRDPKVDLAHVERSWSSAFSQGPSAWIVGKR